MYKMLEISLKKFTDAKVHTIIIGNKRLFWVKLCDVQKRLGVENIYDLLRKNFLGIYETNNPTKKQIRKYKRREKELDDNSNFNCRYDRSDIISKMIMHCRKTHKAVELKSNLDLIPSI